MLLVCFCEFDSELMTRACIQKGIRALYILFLLGSFVITGGLLRIVSGMGTGVTEILMKRS